ncbi:hypothetical protein SKAU_G00306360 [Synaphobranchus kaupii]|uniref:Uncharacterized protein n=1 Tax=Synaphobranchus kaupii TaxID=118154 RepID=A0A9Q1EQW5_SYNKA|nr:hypothetical protein SKAU_G00306360 [Synaphobranchus kaupii]
MAWPSSARSPGTASKPESVLSRQRCSQGHLEKEILKGKHPGNVSGSAVEGEAVAISNGSGNKRTEIAKAGMAKDEEKDKEFPVTSYGRCRRQHSACSRAG